MILGTNKRALAPSASTVVRVRYTGNTGAAAFAQAFVSGTTFTVTNPITTNPTTGATCQAGAATITSKTLINGLAYDLTISTGAGEGTLLITDSFGNTAAIAVITGGETNWLERWTAGPFYSTIYSDAGTTLSTPRPQPAINDNSSADATATMVYQWTGEGGKTLTQSTQANRPLYVGGGAHRGVRFNNTSYMTSNLTVNGRNVHLFFTMSKDALNSANEGGQAQRLCPSLSITLGGLDTFGSSDSTAWQFYFQGAAPTNAVTCPHQLTNPATWTFSSTSSTVNRTRFRLNGLYQEITSNSGAPTSVANIQIGDPNYGPDMTIFQIDAWAGELTLAAEMALETVHNYNFGIINTLATPQPTYAQDLICIGPSTMEGKPGSSNGWSPAKFLALTPENYRVHNLSCGYQMAAKANTNFTQRYSAYCSAPGSTIWILHGDLALVDWSYSNLGRTTAVANLQAVATKAKALGGKVIVIIPFNACLLQGSGTYISPNDIETLRTDLLAMTGVDAWVDMPRHRVVGTQFAGMGMYAQGASPDLAYDATGPHMNSLGNAIVAMQVYATVKSLLSSSGSSLTAADVWNYLITSATTAGSIGKRIADNLAVAVSTPPTAAAIATQVELQIMNESDGQAVLDAMVAKINSVDTNLAGLSIAAIASATRAELESGGNVLDTMLGVISRLDVDYTTARAANLDNLDTPVSDAVNAVNNIDLTGLQTPQNLTFEVNG